MEKPTLKQVWTEIESINKSDRERCKKARFASRIKELTKQNTRMEEALYEIHAISKMSTFVEAMTEEKKKKSCIIL